MRLTAHCFRAWGLILTYTNCAIQLAGIVLALHLSGNKLTCAEVSALIFLRISYWSKPTTNVHQMCSKNSIKPA